MSTLEDQLKALRILLKEAKGSEKEAEIKAQLIELNKQKPKEIQIKTPKGTRDFNDEEMKVRDFVFDTIKSVFKLHGAVTIDTPVFELKEILTGKYGEDSKLIYDLKDQGGELCSLRYDLTVPFARYLAMHGTTNIKRYHIGKVYRRDNPSVQKGRMREFYQCDFDISGVYDTMVADSQCVVVVVEALRRLGLGGFKVKLNHRKILDGMFESCGVPNEMIRTISSAVDKLDKMEWQLVKEEMLEKGLDESVADKIGVFVKYKTRDSLDQLLETELKSNVAASKGIKELKLLYEYLTVLGIDDVVEFDLSLARGLDYYTGVIYEVVIDGTDGVGSIAAGGRYDNLVGMFSGKNVPCVGVSIGVERVFAIMQKKKTVSAPTTKVMVVSPDGNLIARMKCARLLWEADIETEFIYKEKPKIKSQLSACDSKGIPIAVIIGQKEIDMGGATVKILTSKKEEFVPNQELISYIKKALNQ